MSWTSPSPWRPGRTACDGWPELRDARIICATAPTATNAQNALANHAAYGLSVEISTASTTNAARPTPTNTQRHVFIALHPLVTASQVTTCAATPAVPVDQAERVAAAAARAAAGSASTIR